MIVKIKIKKKEPAKNELREAVDYSAIDLEDWI